jgi:hypothetical protein
MSIGKKTFTETIREGGERDIRMNELVKKTLGSSFQADGLLLQATY